MSKPAFKPQRQMWGKLFTYDFWMESVGIPIHRGFYIQDLRTIELGWWEERKCQSAFIQLAGQEGVSAARVTEIAPGETLPPLKFGLDEVVYVVSGRGLTNIWYDHSAKKSFEWQQHSMFLIPHGAHHQFSNMQGDKPVRLLHYSYFPLALSAVPDPDFFFNNAYESANDLAEHEAYYSEAKMVHLPQGTDPKGRQVYWYGNFFPDMKAWEKLDANERRGAGGKSVYILFPNCEMFAHMSVFASRTYKKAHRHGPGRVIVIPAGEGYSIMWEEGKEKVVVPWHECSMFVPPNKWFHQHFNVGPTAARYLAVHSPMQFYGHAEKVEDRAKDQIEYTDEDSFVRKKFEDELAKRGLTSLMPGEAYTNRNFEWSKGMGKQ